MKKLVIINLKDFFEADFNNQFQILGNLEKQLNESELIENVLLVPYKDDGFAVFDLIKIDYSKKTIYTYHYSSTAS